MQQVRGFERGNARRYSASTFPALYAGLLFALPCLAQQTPQATEPATSATPAPPSRIRMFGQNGITAVLFRGSTCVKSVWSEDAEKASGGMGSAFNSFLGRVSSSSLGMPETEASRNLSSLDWPLAKAYFREYAIPADQPSSMRLGFIALSVPSPPAAYGGGMSYTGPSCHLEISFVPGAGKDYEVAFTRQRSTCRAIVNELVRNGDAIELMPVPIFAAPDCPAEDAARQPASPVGLW